MPDTSTTELMPATVREWTDIIARIRFGTVRIAGKGVTGARIKLVAGRLANYADSDGTRVRPGIARLAVDLELDYRSARAAVVHLRAVGLLRLVRAGKGGHADEYRLTLPTDLLERDDLEVWSPARHTLEVGRVREANRGRRKPPPADPQAVDAQGPQGPAQEGDAGASGTSAVPEVLVPEGPALSPDPDSCAGPGGADISRCAGPGGADMQGPQGPATYQGPRHNYDRPSDGDLRTAVTGPRATAAENPESPSARPKKCPDGLSPARRPDGSPECPICRRRESRPGIAVPPPATDRIAPVIPLDSRRIS